MKARLWFALWLVGCGSDDASGPICAACEPERIGDTGDLGGTLTACGYYRAPEPVDAARAVELGFDVEALERAIARPVDMAMEWSASSGNGGGPASGYETSTSVRVRLQSQRTYRHVRPDPQYCDGTTCRFPEETVPQASCARSLETDVNVEVATADGAVRGALTGIAFQYRGGTDDEGSGLAKWSAVVSVSAPLSQVHGSLRLDPVRGGAAYHTRLQLELWCTEAATNGELSPDVLVDWGDGSSVGYYPLLGSFPPFQRGSLDAGVQRR